MAISRKKKRIDQYAKELGISEDELMGLIKTGYYKGENDGGIWFVYPNESLPKTTLGRLFWFLVTPVLFFVLLQVDFELAFSSPTAAYSELLHPVLIGFAVGAALFAFSKINREH